MVAVRNLLSSLNSLAQSGLHARGWRDDYGATAPAAVAHDVTRDLGQGAYAEGGVEPSLDELLDDPVIHLMMRADHLEPEEVRFLLTSGRWRSEP